MISLNDDDYRRIVYSHDNALVVTMLVVANYTTKRILIDNGSSTDVLFWDAFAKMEISLRLIVPSTNHP